MPNPILPRRSVRADVDPLKSYFWAYGGTGQSKDLYVATAAATVANTTDETTLAGSGEGSLTLAADFFTAGRALQIQMRGQLGDTGTPTLNVKVKLGATVICETTATALSGVTDVEWLLDVLLTCRSAGAAGSFIGGGLLDYDDGNEVSLSSGTPVTVDTTGSLALDVTATWGAADALNTITCQEMLVRLVDPNTSEAQNSGSPDLGRVSILTFPGTLVVSSNPLRIYNKTGATQTIREVFLAVGTAPTGAAVIVDIHKNGTTIFTDQGNRPQVAAGDNTGTTTTIDVASWADGEYLTAHIDQVGSTVAGADLVVHIIHSLR